MKVLKIKAYGEEISKENSEFSKALRKLKNP
jgi:hypothetical protein